MPVEELPEQLNTPEETPVWRFMRRQWAQDFFTSGNLYFCRCDCFDDEYEGLPPMESFRLLNRYDLNDRKQMNSRIGFSAEARESFFVNCWTRHSDTHENRMWNCFAPDGIAIQSQYGLLHSQLNQQETRMFFGAVRYSPDNALNNYANGLRDIMIKRRCYTFENEIRALIWETKWFKGGTRCLDGDHVPLPNIPPPPPGTPGGILIPINLKELVTGVVISPRAASSLKSEVEEWVKAAGLDVPVVESDLKPYLFVLPDTCPPLED